MAVSRRVSKSRGTRRGKKGLTQRRHGRTNGDLKPKHSMRQRGHGIIISILTLVGVLDPAPERLIREFFPCSIHNKSVSANGICRPPASGPLAIFRTRGPRRAARGLPRRGADAVVRRLLTVLGCSFYSDTSAELCAVFCGGEWCGWLILAGSGTICVVGLRLRVGTTILCWSIGLIPRVAVMAA